MTRFVLKPFASTGGVTGQFGSFEANGGQVGDGVLTDDNDTIQGLPAWIDGWDAATNNALKLPRLEEMNGVDKVFSEFAIQNHMDGITYWQAGMSVTANQSVVQYDGKLYLNITGTNTATAPDSDTTNWKYVLDLTKEYVDTTSAQNISGIKTFTSATKTVGASVKFQNTAFTSASATQGDTLLDIQARDKDNLLRYFLTGGQHTNDIINFGLGLNKTDGSTLAAFMTLNYNKTNDTAYVACTTPALTAAGNEIITASWFNQKSVIPRLNFGGAVAKSGSSWTLGANEYGCVFVSLRAPSYGSAISAGIKSGTVQPSDTGFVFASCGYEGLGAGMTIAKPNDHIIFKASDGAYVLGCTFVPFA